MPPSGQYAARLFSAALLAVCGAALAVVTACNSTNTSVAAPTSPRCQATVAGSPGSFPSTGGSGSVQVTTDRDCQWTAAPGASWITVGTTSGQGNGTVPFTVAPNSAVAARDGSISVNGAGFSISQQPAPCSFAVSPTQISATADGGAESASVSAQSGCAWTASSNDPWITVVAGASGNGAGAVQMSVAPNTGGARTGTVTAAGQTVAIDQAAAAAPPPPPPPPPPPGPGACSVATLSPTSQSFPSTGGTGSISVTGTGPVTGCTWTATSAAGWVTITAGTTGIGDGTVSFSVQSTKGAARSTTITIAGQTFTVSEASGKK